MKQHFMLGMYYPVIFGKTLYPIPQITTPFTLASYKLRFAAKKSQEQCPNFACNMLIAPTAQKLCIFFPVRSPIRSNSKQKLEAGTE